MSIYTGINDFTKNTSSLYLGVGGKSKRIIKGYIGIDGQAKLFYYDNINYAYLSEYIYNTKSTVSSSSPKIKNINNIFTSSEIDNSDFLANTPQSKYKISYYGHTLKTQANYIILNKNSQDFLIANTSYSISIDNLIFSFAENLSNFGGYSAFGDITNKNFNKAINISRAFYNSKIYGSITNKNFNNVENISFTFYNTNINGIVPKIPKGYNFRSAFYSTNIDSIENDFFIDNVFYGYTFSNCYNLNLPDNYKIKSNNSNFSYTFQNCKNINSNIILKINNGQMYKTFENCSNIKSFSGIITNLNNTYNCFNNIGNDYQITYNLIIKNSNIQGIINSYYSPSGNLYLDNVNYYGSYNVINIKNKLLSLPKRINIYINSNINGIGRNKIYRANYIEDIFYDSSSGTPILKNYYYNTQYNVYIYENYWPQNEVDTILQLIN